MSNIIHTTTSKDEQILAAKLISKTLTKLGYRNTIIGGFALRMLGSERTTNDVDILVETEDATDAGPMGTVNGGGSASRANYKSAKPDITSLSKHCRPACWDFPRSLVLF